MADMWHVTSQNLRTVLADSGTGFENVWEVTFKVDSGPATGTVAMVRVPASMYNAETVQQAITASVYHIDQIAGL